MVVVTAIVIIWEVKDSLDALLLLLNFNNINNGKNNYTLHK